MNRLKAKYVVSTMLLDTESFVHVECVKTCGAGIEQQLFPVSLLRRARSSYWNLVSLRPPAVSHHNEHGVFDAAACTYTLQPTF